MASEIIPLISSNELLIIEAYLDESNEKKLQAEKLLSRFTASTESSVTNTSVAVTKILLSHIQDQLPHSYISYRDEEGLQNLIDTRTFYRSSQKSILKFNPIFLFSINWAETGPGYGWPEAYYLTLFPSYGKGIVTASRDSTDVWGCTDHAIGWFYLKDSNPERDALEVIEKYWTKQLREYEQAEWESMTQCGAICVDDIYDLQMKVWG